MFPPRQLMLPWVLPHAFVLLLKRLYSLSKTKAGIENLKVGRYITYVNLMAIVINIDISPPNFLSSSRNNMIEYQRVKIGQRHIHDVAFGAENLGGFMYPQISGPPLALFRFLRPVAHCQHHYIAYLKISRNGEIAINFSVVF